MKVLLSFAVVFVTLFAVSFAADCVIKGHSFNKGETYAPPGECINYTCSGVRQLSALGCAAYSAPAHCKYIPEDRTKPYPKCCPRYEC